MNVKTTFIFKKISDLDIFISALMNSFLISLVSS